jgi:hypothetical protein
LLGWGLNFNPTNKKLFYHFNLFNAEGTIIVKSERVSSEFEEIANEVFGILLTITTILSGVYVSVTFGWFGQAMIEPHTGGPITYEMLVMSIGGIVLGTVFILPLVFILLSWAFAKFRNSTRWATAAWSGLIYCLAQDLIGIVTLFNSSLIASGAIVGLKFIVAGAFVLLPPPVLGILIGHRIGVNYSKLNQATQEGNGHPATPAVIRVFLILVVQVSLVTFLFLGGI